MALTPGTRLGVDHINAQIGLGGMRSMAIDVLPASVVGDADRVARFQRDAEVHAAFNHPNIGAVNGLEKTPDLTAFLVELVEGEDPSQRNAPGAIPVDDCLPTAKQIGQARESAPVASTA